MPFVKYAKNIPLLNNGIAVKLFRKSKLLLKTFIGLNFYMRIHASKCFSLRKSRIIASEMEFDRSSDIVGSTAVKIIDFFVGQRGHPVVPS